MTREEAIEELKILKEDYWDDDGYGHETKQYDDTMLALDMAIEALEQEQFINKPCVSSGVCEHDKQKALDKIRAEIDNALSDGMIHKKTVLGIIDKYKAEREDNNE